MSFIEKSINSIEKQYNNKKNKKRLILLLNRYYLGFLTMDKIDYLNKAYNCCAEYLNNNKSDFDILLAILFFSINIDDKEKIDYFNNNISKYKKYLKNNDIDKYSFYLFLQGLIKAKKGSVRGTNKYIKALQNIDSDFCIIYITLLKIYINNMDRNILLDIENIHHSIFWKNIILYIVFEKKSNFLSFEKQTFKNYVKWALYKGINIEKSIIRYENSILFYFNEDIFNKKIYKEYNIDSILLKICQEYLKNNIHTKISYFFFKEGINRQISLPGLNTSYIKACYKSNMEDIGLYPIKQFLKEPNVDLEIMSFIYYIILSNKKYIELVVEEKDKILKYGGYFLEKGCVGRYYYTIYKYILDFIPTGSLEERKIMNVLYPNNFLYEIYVEDDNAQTILIKDNDIDSVQEYNIENNIVVVKSSSKDFNYYIFSKNKNEILNCKININKLVEGTNGKYFYRFYKTGYKDKFTIINTIKYYLKIDNTDNNKTELLQNVLGIDDISTPLKMQVILTLGNINFYNKDYETATMYYKKVLEKYIGDKYIDNIVKSYIFCKEYYKSIEIIKKKYRSLEDDTLFYAIKEISKESIYNKTIAIFAYELLIRSKVDDVFIDIVVKNYKGGLKEWIELRKTLQNMGIIKKEIDEYILKLAVYTHSIDNYVEQIFMDLYNNDTENKSIEYFLNYCMYQAFNGDYIFSDDILYIMEYIFKETNNSIIGYALGHIYLKGNYNLENKYKIFEKIIQNMEEEQLGFKIFENNKDKFKKFSYLYKNKPFVYNTYPNKDVYLCYKNINQEKFMSIKMKYFKFGIYIVTLPIFYGEDIEYYFAENTENGSICTKKFFATNIKSLIFDIDDKYFKINNAFVYTYEGRYDEAHKVIEELIAKDYNLKGKIL